MKPARILVLVIALAAGGIAALLAGRSDDPKPDQAPVAQLETVEVLVASNDIGIGTSVSGQDLRWQTWPAAAASANFIRKGDRPDAINQLAGSITRQPFSAGEPIREIKLIKAKGSGYMAAILPQGMRAIATDITPESGVSGFILPNDHVDVILSRRDKEAEKAAGGVEVHSSEIILSNVRVLAIDQTVEEKNGQRVVVGKTATLELAPSQTETLARARQMGNLSLALRSIVDFESKDGVVEEKDTRRTGVNVVRFGITSTTTAK
ncbi:MAG: pilus assembly protein CpaB [Alphaproteobacteria bacterium]|jgi:pilus assembly protein CpaB|nr:pilus assembly protein CpaB [Alphaproteobacteria bacterium]